MSEDGYEMMGPARGPNIPPPTVPPGQKLLTAPPSAPPMAVVQRKNQKKSKKSKKSGSDVEATDRSVLEPTTKRSALRSVMSESVMETSRMESAESSNGINQRPNACDVVQLSLVIFSLVIVLGISIPVLLAATGNMDIDWIVEKLMELEEE